MRRTVPGVPYPLGATLDSDGVNFALYSENASAVELCLFDEDDRETRIRINHRTAYVWHVFVPELAANTRYGYRVHGPYDPERGHRFNPHVVLMDPYAKATDGVEKWQRGCFAYQLGQSDLQMTETEQLGAPRAIVVDPAFDWEGDSPLVTPLHRSVIYEAHVRGLTMRHPEVPEALRGTYLGVAHPAVIKHLKDLGITAIELMPIHGFVDEQHLLERGLRNYWGYSSIGFFTPDSRYRSSALPGAEVHEFKTMVKALHRAGLEVILDVVYNHTAEGNHQGPTFNFKGIDNSVYYRLVGDNPRYYFDYTGTGNTFNVRHPQVLALIMDSLRYWASEMHVDGFRFDLASSLARQLHEVDRLSSFFTLIHQAPALRNAKIIAEPWDVGDGGYQVGNFPVRWAEWNGRYRDAVRKLWRGDGGHAAEIGYRLTGSSDLYAATGRRPSASINLVTAHDGYTLRDLVTYQQKHNEANGEGNQDGANDEHGWNCGHEGPTDDPEISRLRLRQQRNLLMTLLLSQGTPMLVGGDEFGRTQLGNNNAYCQDNEISWYDWSFTDDQRALLEFTKRLLNLRSSHPALRRAHFFQGRSIRASGVADIRWFRNDGESMSEEDWHNPATSSFGMFLAGRGIDDVDDSGRPLVDDDLLILINASHMDLDFEIPRLVEVGEPWQLLVDSADDSAEETLALSQRTRLVGRSMKFFRAASRVVRTGGEKHTLGATYRLQMNADFDFAQASAVLDYLVQLGITDVYSAPLLRAATGSTHGYDVVDHSQISPALGGRPGFELFSANLKKHGLGLLVDWVPNHMGIEGGENAWWDDLLENGPSSAFADHFDVEWDPPKHGLTDRVLLPVLGSQYGDVLEAGQLQLVWEGGNFKVAYFEHRWPVGPKTLVPIIEAICSGSGIPESEPTRQELESVLSAMRHLPDRRETAIELRRERAREKEVIKRRLRTVLDESEPTLLALVRVLAEVNGEVGEPRSFDRLDALLGVQSYRLASWRVASEEINYRRFFDINSLAAIRMEAPDVFEHSHALLFELIDKDQISALRLDHTDGLYDPLGYFEALQSRFRRSTQRLKSGPDDLARPLPVLVEKILERGEQLPADWPVDGTTGYDFGGVAMGVFVDARNERAISATYAGYTGDGLSFAEHVYQSKHQILRYSLACEINMLGRSLERIANANRRWRDFTLISLTRGLIEVLAAFPVYRTYLREGSPASEYDVSHIQGAISEARKNNAAISISVFDFIEEVLLLRTEESGSERAEHERFALRFQQLSGPVKAKAVEDTAFYRYHRLVCLNEVGGDPAKFGSSIGELHALNAERLRAWPLGMVTLATHDSKRGEDTSARIAVLSEMPEVWRRALRAFGELSEGARETVDGESAPGRGLEYLFYQTLIGTWPIGWDGQSDRESFLSRLTEYLRKASKEAKQQTSWTSPHPEYDSSVERFVKGMLENDRFMNEARLLSEAVAPHGASNGLALTLLKLCSPGIPDTYQGSEFWNQTLVDPDNRRPVDFGARRAALATIIRERAHDAAGLSRALLQRYGDGNIKLYVTYVALMARKQARDLYLHGDYQALPGNEHVFAFTRSKGSERMLCAVSRLPYRKLGGEPGFAVGAAWGDERLRVPFTGRYRNLFTGEEVELGPNARLSDLFKELPVALLHQVIGRHGR
ncbi:MAG: glycogen debranching protein GlgX [Polyangiaceae bacterium]